MRRVIVIGGGASGLMAAITAARKGAQVTILEGSEKPGKKILITGNGRCNLTNMDVTRKDAYRSNQKGVADSVLTQFSQEDTVNFFHEIGLMTHMRGTGVYPVTDQASSVLEILLAEAFKWKIKIKCTEKVSSIEQRNDRSWQVKTNSWTYECERVILACGSKSYPATGSDGSGYQIAETLKLPLVQPSPALVPLLVQEKYVKKLSGIRSSARVQLLIEDKGKVEAHVTETGEVQWTDYGVSGIVIFQLSRYAVRALRDGKNASLLVELLPDTSEEALYHFICSCMNKKNMGEALLGILPKKMIPVILELSGQTADRSCDSVEEKQIRKLVACMKKLRLTVTGSKGFDMAQVCSGGISLDEVYEKTLEVKKYPGLYIAGELLDVDGICGGYNLQWAWSSGYAAGMASAE